MEGAEPVPAESSGRSVCPGDVNVATWLEPSAVPIPVCLIHHSISTNEEPLHL